MTDINTLPAARLVDKLGALRADIAELQEQAKRYESILKESGDGAYEGDYYRATVSTSTDSTWGPSRISSSPSRVRSGTTPGASGWPHAA